MSRSSLALAPALAPGATLQVEIVEAETARPVPAAEVWYRPGKNGFEPTWLDELIARPDTGATRADAEGQASIPWSGNEPLLVFARSPGRLGGEQIEPSPSRDELGRVRIELYRDWDLAVEVVDAKAAPAPDVTVGAEMQGGSIWDETDASGRITIAHVGAELALAGETRTVVEVVLALAEPLTRTIALENPPTGVVRFQLPPLGSLSVSVLDPEHQPVPDGTSVQLGLVPEGEEREPSAFAPEREYVEQETRAGHVEFAHVALGGEIELVITEERGEQPEKHYLRGPRAEGEHLDETLVLARDWPILVLRALDGSGAALAQTKLLLELHHRSGVSIDDQAREVTTDADGRFEVDCPGEFFEGDRRWLGVERDGTGARLVLERVLPHGRVDLGDLVLAELPLLVSGRVVDGGGVPLAGAELELELPVMNGADGGGGVWFWKALERRGSSDAGGNFALRTLALVESARVHAEFQGRRSECRVIAPASHGVELVVQATGSLTGKVLCDPDVPLSLVHVHVENASRSAEDDRSERTLSCEVAADGSFRRDELLPGTYDLSVGVEDQERLLVLERIEVPSGGNCTDPRLDGIDLRGRLHRMRLVLRTSEAGDEYHGPASVTCRPAASTEGEEMHWSRTSPVEWLTPYASVDGRLVVRGFRPTAFTGLSGEREFRLVPSPTVQLVLPAGIVLPEPPDFLKAALAPEDDYWLLDYGAPVFDERHETTSLAAHPGRLRVYWILEQRAAKGGSAEMLEIEPVQWVEVRDVDATQRFELELTNEVLAAALAKARAD